MLGKKASGLKLKEVIPDLGIRKPHTTGAIFSALKGVIDSGIHVTHKEVSEEESVFPAEDRINGNHLKNKENYEDIKVKIIK